MKKVILLTGAAGTVGRETLRELAQRVDRYDIRVLELRTPQTEKVLHPYCDGADIRWVDLTDQLAVDANVCGVDAAIHLAAIIPPLADRQPKLAERVNVDGTRHLIEALQRHAPQTFFLYASSVSVYGDRVQNPWISVNDPLRPSVGDAYAVTKIKAEKLVQHSRLAWSIFRLTGSIAPTTGIDPLFFHMPLDTCFELATTRDVGYAFAQAVEHTAGMQGRIYNLAGGPACRLTYRELLDRSFQIFGLGPLDFPPEAFADQNFHCGYFTDSDELENLLHFQRDTVDSCFAGMARNIGRWQKTLARLFRVSIKRRLLQQSEPYRAWREKDPVLAARFFRQAAEN
jgi:nucleoside-diphosphate-sugar epimerase